MVTGIRSETHKTLDLGLKDNFILYRMSSHIFNIHTSNYSKMFDLCKDIVVGSVLWSYNGLREKHDGHEGKQIRNFIPIITEEVKIFTTLLLLNSSRN